MTEPLRLEPPFYSPEAVSELLDAIGKHVNRSAFESQLLSEASFCEKLNQALRRSIESHERGSQ